jgi:hypothetical protein
MEKTLYRIKYIHQLFRKAINKFSDYLKSAIRVNHFFEAL